jgi:Tol biopolymer transport system component
MRVLTFALLLALALVCATPAQAAVGAGPRLGLIRFIDRSAPKGGSLDVITSDGAGGAPQLVTGTSRPAGIAPIGGFAWSPNGQEMAVGTVTGTDFQHLLFNDEFDLFLLAADGSGLRQLTAFLDDPGERSDDAVAPTFSSDGNTVYFARVRNLLHASIWAIGIDGTGLRQLTPERGRFGFDIPSSVSPLGDELAFTRVTCSRKFGCRSDARAVSLVTGADRLLARRSIDPAFSPDGSQIALASYPRRHRHRNSNELLPVTDLYVVDAGGGVARRLTRSKTLSEGHPSWDPSGQRIAYSRGASTLSAFLGETDNLIHTRILQINADGTCKTTMFRGQLPKGPYFGRDFSAPAWQPGTGSEAGPIVC